MDKEFAKGWAKVGLVEVMRNGRLWPAEKAVLLLLMSFKRAHPPMAVIMGATNLGEKQVRGALESLRDMGVLTWVSGNRGKANTYTVCCPTIWNLRELNKREEEHRKKVSDKQLARQVLRRKRLRAAAKKHLQLVNED